MRRVQTVLAASVYFVLVCVAATGAALAQAPETDAAPGPAVAPQVFVLDVRPGPNLVSLPLDTGRELARDAFGGLSPEWPHFYGWSSSRREWVPGSQAPAGAGSGYWLYSETPAKLVVRGTPYSSLKSLKRKIDPGWHLFGVPFTQGIDWHQFQLFASGNPIGLETAVQLGWIDPTVTSIRGGETTVHAPGTPFEPGRAYWISTSRTLEVRADHRRSAPLPSGAGPASGPASPRRGSSGLVGGAASGTIGVLGGVSEMVKGLFEGGHAWKEGMKWTAGATFVGSTFGLLEHLVVMGERSEMLETLGEIDAKLDTVIEEVKELSAKMDELALEIAGLDAKNEAEKKLGTPLTQAENWLETYYRDPFNPVQSREWARWKLAGCDTTDPTLSRQGCPQPVDPATLQPLPVAQEQYDAFVKSYMTDLSDTHPDGYRNFPLYWANGVIDGFQSGGSTANLLVQAIHKGIFSDRALEDYLTALLDLENKVCTTDPSSANCDLFNNVYLPLEAYFGKAIAAQAQLAAAHVEALGAKAEDDFRRKNPGATGEQGAQTDVVATYMNDFDRKLAQEVNEYLRVVEKAALVRASSGRVDWNTFPSSDAGQLLARADFVAALLVGRNYVDTASDPATPLPWEQEAEKAPWPSEGVVGRIFYPEVYVYPDQSLVPHVAVSRTACSDAAAAGSRTTCPAPGPSAWSWQEGSTGTPVDGTFPYLAWGEDGIATATFRWNTWRLKPLAFTAPLTTSVPDGSYSVQSSLAGRYLAKMAVATYDENYINPPQPGSARSIRFSSFSSLEGNLGQYAVPGALQMASTRNNYSGDLVFSKITLASDGPALLLRQSWNSSYETKTQDSQSINPLFGLSVRDKDSILTTYRSLRISWPTSSSINLDSSRTTATAGGCSGSVGFYDPPQFGMDVYDLYAPPFPNGTNDTPVASQPFSECGSSRFKGCTATDSEKGLDLPPIRFTLLGGGEEVQFGIRYSTKVYPFNSCIMGVYFDLRFPVAGSFVEWRFSAPMFTLSKD